MKQQKYYSSLIISSFLISINLLFIPSFHKKAQAQNNQIINFTSPIPNFGSSDDTPYHGDRGAGSRTDELFCETSNPNPSIKALFPNSNYTITREANPTIYVYLPPGSVSDISLYLYEQDDQGNWKVNTDLIAIIPINHNLGGITPISFAQLKPLIEGKIYKWSLTVNCQENSDVITPSIPLEMIDINSNSHVYPTIERVSLEPINSLETEELSLETAYNYIENNQVSSALNLAISYAQKGLFLESCDILVRLKQEFPNDEMVLRAWEQLLMII